MSASDSEKGMGESKAGKIENYEGGQEFCSKMWLHILKETTGN